MKLDNVFPGTRLRDIRVYSVVIKVILLKLRRMQTQTDAAQADLQRLQPQRPHPSVERATARKRVAAPSCRPCPQVRTTKWSVLQRVFLPIVGLRFEPIAARACHTLGLVWAWALGLVGDVVM